MSTEVSAAKEIIKTSDNELGADQIADYLRKNPEFFIEQEGLLADLSLPHESGKAISLLERQVTILRDRGIEARQKLNNLLENARNNDQLFDTTRNLVMALLRANNLTEIVAVAQENLSNHTNIDACQIILIEQPQLDVSNAVKTDSEKNLKTDFADVFRLKRTHCGTLTQDQIDYLFADSGKSIRSTALCPVVNNSEVFALLAFGNQEENFFNINLDTLFLDFIGQVVGAVFYRMLAANSS
ncbi:MAG TPA: DUF484 family protein [Porticoccaceae bacterium]|jgi:uncharacterized protein YigA (DUF484 family)|nr:DUF484 family protein [Gammaproteobacteria bacterium]HIL60060.1 DUF484 family protein [Porticoccaceae bacterium]